jgi:Glu-tRNA(Gln) amidotransferase subunit E-like FAD-binding protein
MSNSQGLTNLEQKIKQFEDAILELKLATREAHSVLKELKREHKEIENLFKGEDVKLLVKNRVDEVVSTQLEEIGPQIRKQTNLIYDKVGNQIDKIIDIALGKEFSVNHNRADLRPELAAKMRIWIREVISSEDLKT